MSTAVPDIPALTHNIPSGAWVAISQDGQRVLAYGVDLHSVVDQAHTNGENDPIVTRVPESNAIYIL